MVLQSVLIAGSFPVVAAITPGQDPVVLTWLRFALALAALLMLPVLWRSLRFELRHLWRYALTGGLYAGFFVAMFEALKTAQSVQTALLYTSVPFLSALLAFVFFGERVAWRRLAVLVAALAGALWVITQGEWQRLIALQIGQGERIFLIGCLCMALYVPLVKRLYQNEGWLVFTFRSLLAGTGWLTLWAAPELLGFAFAELPWAVWSGLLYLAVVTTGVTLFLMQFAAHHLPSVSVMAYIYLTPAAVVLIEGLIGHGWPDGTVWVGVGFTLAALIGFQRLGDKKENNA